MASSWPQMASASLWPRHIAGGVRLVNPGVWRPTLTLISSPLFQSRSSHAELLADAKTSPATPPLLLPQVNDPHHTAGQETKASFKLTFVSTIKPKEQKSDRLGLQILYFIWENRWCGR
jgi:hypothetical protein